MVSKPFVWRSLKWFNDKIILFFKSMLPIYKPIISGLLIVDLFWLYLGDHNFKFSKEQLFNYIE